MTALIKVKSNIENLIYDYVRRFDIAQKGESWFLYLEIGSYEKIYIALDDILRFTISER